MGLYQCGASVPVKLPPNPTKEDCPLPPLLLPLLTMQWIATTTTNLRRKKKIVKLMQRIVSKYKSEEERASRIWKAL